MELKEMFVLPVWTQLTAMKGWATADKGLPKQQQLKPYGATAKLKTTTTFAEFHSFWSTAHDKDNQGSRTLIIITDKKYHTSRSQNMYWMIVRDHQSTGRRDYDAEKKNQFVLEDSVVVTVIIIMTSW